MSIQRCLAPLASSPTFFKFASPSIPRSCPHGARTFTSSMSIRLSSKRKLVTTAAHRPESLNPPPPPRNAGVADTSIAGAVPEVHDIRPPPIGEHAKEISESERPSQQPTISLPEKEAQKSNSVEREKPAGSQESSTKSRRPKLRPRKAAMNLTPAAITHLRALLEQPDPKLIRVGVKNRGCSGLAYHLEYVEKPGTFDEAVEQDGVKVLIDSKALFSIIGSEMDWVEDKLNQRFIFRNPNIKEQCGCGESFMV